MKPAVLLTFDSMRHANTGLHSFGHRLGSEIVRQAQTDLKVSAYTYPPQQGFLGDAANYVRHRKFHRWFFPQRAQFELVHFADQYCRFGPARVRGRTIMTVHDLNQLHEQGIDSARVRKHMARMQIKVAGADHIVAISHFVAADIVRHFPEARAKLSVIHNGADWSAPPAGHRPAVVPTQPFLFALGMVCPKKNFHVLVPLLRGNGRQLLIAGVLQEPYRQKILAEAAAWGVADRVIITGAVSAADKNWYYANCEAFAFPSLAEGFGLPVIEAMYHGKPVFLSTLTALPEVGGDAAYYFENFDPAHMAQVFEAGLADFNEHGGAERVRLHASQFTWERAAAAYLALYRRCLA
ncbi:glycosyltransferase family 4 protein [Massilia sp. DWR3-1-1]|uniref:glycosyltransferase family 4 protein n=1 Tax=Massilia sp. DWR3-1-1 TaxID=2804559 RepID=UPI003CF34680